MSNSRENNIERPRMIQVNLRSRFVLQLDAQTQCRDRIAIALPSSNGAVSQAAACGRVASFK